MPDDSLGVMTQDFPVLHLHLDRFTAVQANRIDLDCLTGKKPADR